MKCTRLVILLLLVASNVFSQSNLVTLDVPTNRGRYDDIFFINDSVGWVCGGQGSGAAKIYNTRNGGDSWTEQFSVNKYLRSIEFASEQVGFCGSLDSTLYKTVDGGKTWTDITARIPRRPKGICGLAIPDANTVYGVGKYSGPAFVIKSSDAGANWSYIDMSAYAKGLVDVFFFNKDEGFVAGISNTDGGVILYTKDGGATWSFKFKTQVNGDYIWKIQSPDNIHFYASVDGMPFNNDSRYIKSSDGGKTWVPITWSHKYIHIQGIGFINDKIGWIGGDRQLYKTVDGGDHWTEDSFNGPAFDRFHKVNSKIGYLSGQGVFRYNMLKNGNQGNTRPNPIHYLEVTPNPVTTSLKIQTVFKYATYAMLMIYSNDGKLVAQLLEENVKGGSKTSSYDLSAKTAGVYYIILKTNEGMIYKKIVKQ